MTPATCVFADDHPSRGYCPYCGWTSPQLALFARGSTLGPPTPPATSVPAVRVVE